MSDIAPRAVWARPELKKIDAGSAEASKTSGVNDGGKSPPQKS